MRKFLIGARKYLIGAFVGAALVFSSQVFAAGLIGKEVQGEIIVVFDGTELSTTGVVIDGVSYLPLRAIGTVLGLGVDYSAGVVTLTSPGSSGGGGKDVADGEPKYLSPEDVRNEMRKYEIEKEISKLETAISGMQKQIQDLKADGTLTETVEATMLGIITKQEAQLAELRAELSDLESSNE